MPALDAYADAAPDLVATSRTPTRSVIPSSTSSRTSTRFWSAPSVWPTSATTWSAPTGRRSPMFCTCWCRPRPARRVPRKHFAAASVGSSRSSQVSPQYSGVMTSSSLTWGSSATAIRRTCRRSRPRAVARPARSQGCPICRRTSSAVLRRATSAPTRAQYGNQGILLNSDALKNGCSDRSMVRRATAHRSDSRDDAINGHADQVHHLRGGHGAADRLPVLGLQ